MMDFSDKLIVFFSNFSGFSAYSVIFGVLLACGFGLPLPEDIILVSAGIMASQGSISLWGGIVVGYVGVMAGDSILFFMGRRLGPRVFTYPVFKHIFTESIIKRASEKVLHNQKFICFTARFLPGLRAPIYLMSGIMGVKPRTFFVLDSIAAILSVPAWVVVGYWFGNNIDEVLAFAKEMQIYVLLLISIFILSYYLYKKKFVNSPK